MASEPGQGSTFSFTLPLYMLDKLLRPVITSEGGIGALVQTDLMVGGVVEVDLQLPRCSLCAVAIVRYISSTRSGLEFLGLTPEERS